MTDAMLCAQDRHAHPCPRQFLYGVQVNPSLVGEGIREALKEGND